MKAFWNWCRTEECACYFLKERYNMILWLTEFSESALFPEIRMWPAGKWQERRHCLSSSILQSFPPFQRDILWSNHHKVCINFEVEKCLQHHSSCNIKLIVPRCAHIQHGGICICLWTRLGWSICCFRWQCQTWHHHQKKCHNKKDSLELAPPSLLWVVLLLPLPWRCWWCHRTSWVWYCRGVTCRLHGTGLLKHKQQPHRQLAAWRSEVLGRDPWTTTYCLGKSLPCFTFVVLIGDRPLQSSSGRRCLKNREGWWRGSRACYRKWVSEHLQEIYKGCSVSCGHTKDLCLLCRRRENGYQMRPCLERKSLQIRPNLLDCSPASGSSWWCRSRRRLLLLLPKPDFQIDRQRSCSHRRRSKMKNCVTRNCRKQQHKTTWELTHPLTRLCNKLLESFNIIHNNT